MHTNRYTLIIIYTLYYYLLFLAVGIISIIFVQFFKKMREKSPPYPKLDENIPMTTKHFDGWKYKKLEDGESDDSSDSTTTDEHKKMLN